MTAAISDEERALFPIICRTVFREAQTRGCWVQPPPARVEPGVVSQSVEANKRALLWRASQSALVHDRALFLQVMDAAIGIVITSELRLLLSELRLNLAQRFKELYQAIDSAPPTADVWKEMKHCYSQRRHVHRRQPTSTTQSATIAIQSRTEGVLNQAEVSDGERRVEMERELSSAMAQVDGFIQESSSSVQLTMARLRHMAENCVVADGWLPLLERIQNAQPSFAAEAESAAGLLPQLKDEAEAIRCRLSAWDDNGILVAIVGNAKTGKSTFANSLIGKPLLLAANGRCSMVVTYVHLNVLSKRARLAGEVPTYEILLEYRSREEAHAEVHDWRDYQLSMLTPDSPHPHTEIFNGEAGYHQAIADFRLPDGLQWSASGPEPEPIIDALRDTGGMGKEHMVFLLRSVHVWLNGAATPNQGLLGLCVVDFPATDSAQSRQAQRDADATLASSDVIFYIHSVGNSTDLSAPARDSLCRLMVAADRALGQDGAGDADGEQEAPRRQLENLFVICTYVQHNEITVPHEQLRQHLRDRGVQRNGIFFADARLPSMLGYAARPTEQLLPAERVNDVASVNGGRLRHFDECAKEWLVIYSQFSAFVYAGLPALIQQRLHRLLLRVRNEMDRQSRLLGRQWTTGANALSMDAHREAVLTEVWPTFEEQRQMELRFALQRSFDDERHRLHSDAGGSVPYLGSLLAQLRRQWLWLHEAERQNTDSLLEVPMDLHVHGDWLRSSPQTALAELLHRDKLECQYTLLSDRLLHFLADEVRRFLDQQFAVITETAFPGSDIVRQHLQAVLQPHHVRGLESILPSLRGAAAFFAQARTALLLYPLEERYGERRQAMLELIATLQPRMQSIDELQRVRDFASARLPDCIPDHHGVLEPESLLHRLRLLAEVAPRHLPLQLQDAEDEKQRGNGASELDTVVRQTVAEHLAAFTASDNQDTLKEQLRALCPRFHLVIQNRFRELGRVGVAQHVAGLLGEAGVEEPQRLSETLRDLLFTLAQGRR